MRFVKVNYHLNKKFFVEDYAYQEMVLKTMKSIKENIKVEELDILCDEKNNAFLISLTIKKDKNIEYALLVNKIQSELEEKSRLLINAKPGNIRIKFVEEK